MVLARLLNPDDFGTIGLIMVFVGMADVMVDGGLGNALIQKIKLNNNDISTVFSSNLVISLFLFLLIFIFAPALEQYTEVEKFSLYLRVESLMIILRALYVVNFSLTNKQLHFKELSVINISANFIAVIASITMAIYGCGIWSLIFRNIILDLTLLIIYSIRSRIHVRIGFDKLSFRQLFNFGSFIALSNVLESLYSNVVSFFIGKMYSVKDLGYYNQAYSLVQIPIYSVTSVLNQVLFPFFSINQNDKNKIKLTTKTSIQVFAFCLYPIIVYLICFAKPIIILLYSEKWLPAVPYFQILCLTGFFNAIIHINRSVLKSLGYSHLLFKIQLALSMIGLFLVYIGLQYSLKILIFFIVLNTFISLTITGLFAGNKIGYSIYKQMLDVLPIFVISVVVGLLCFFGFRFIEIPNILQAFLGIIFYGIFYILLNAIFKIDVFLTLKQYGLNILQTKHYKK